jgi:hypothetical protein
MEEKKMFLKAVTLEGKTEYFNVEKIISIKPDGSNVKILMGAGLFWNVKRYSLEFIHPEQMLFIIKEK